MAAQSGSARRGGWASRMNSMLGRTVGINVVSPQTTEDARQWKQAQRKPAAPAPKPPAPPSPKAIPKDLDDADKAIIEKVQPWTMTSPGKLHALLAAVRYVTRHNIPGDIVECGVWRGGSMQAAALTLLECGDPSRHLYLFDTFEGMPPPSEHDRRLSDGAAAEDLLAKSGRDSGVWAVATLDDVQNGLSRIPYPQDNIHYVPGLVEDTVPDGAPETISILRLDTDWYASTKHELETLYDRLVPGGVLLIDDYGWWEGARKAVDEFLESRNLPLLLLRMDEGRVALKR